MDCWSWASELGMEGEIVFLNSECVMTIVMLCVVAYKCNVDCCCWYLLLMLLLLLLLLLFTSTTAAAAAY